MTRLPVQAQVPWSSSFLTSCERELVMNDLSHLTLYGRYQATCTTKIAYDFCKVPKEFFLLSCGLVEVLLRETCMIFQGFVWHAPSRLWCSSVNGLFSHSDEVSGQEIQFPHTLQWSSRSCIGQPSVFMQLLHFWGHNVSGQWPPPFGLIWSFLTGVTLPDQL